MAKTDKQFAEIAKLTDQLGKWIDKGQLDKNIDKLPGMISKIDLDASGQAALAQELTSVLPTSALVGLGLGGLIKAPTAVADILSVGEDDALSANLLTNDTANGSTIRVASVTDGSVGTSFEVVSAGGRTGVATIAADGTLNFQPGTDFQELMDGESDTLSIEYKIENEFGANSFARAIITVDGETETPVSTNYTLNFDQVPAQANEASSDNYFLKIYHEQGFTISNNGLGYVETIGAEWKDRLFYSPTEDNANGWWPGSVVLGTNFGDTETYVTRDDGGYFAMRSIEIDSFELIAQSVKFIGTGSDGATVIQEFTIDASRGLQKFEFSEEFYTPLEKVTITGYNYSNRMFDNISIDVFG